MVSFIYFISGFFIAVSLCSFVLSCFKAISITRTDSNEASND